MPMIDCQQETAHLARFGAQPISRKAFAGHLVPLVNSGAPDSAWVPLPASEVLT
jgi:Leu/Phe-tRNA-protein transferase